MISLAAIFPRPTDPLRSYHKPEQKKIYQAMIPEKKLQVALDLYYSAKELKAAGLKQQHPEWSTERIRQKVREISFMPEPNLFRIFVSRLNKLSIPYMITGAVASIIYGEPRLTNDIDIDKNASFES
jgi:hypothetical protein